VEQKRVGVGGGPPNAAYPIVLTCVYLC